MAFSRLTAPFGQLTGGLGGYRRAGGGSSTPAWPSTNLLVAYDFANASPASGTLTTWPKTAGSGGNTLTPTGTVTNGATGVTVSTSYVSDIGVTLPATDPFTIYFVGSRTASNQIVIFTGGILDTNDTFAGLYSDGSLYVISQGNQSVSVACSVSGTFAARLRRNVDGDIFFAATGFAEVTLALAAPEYVYQLQTIGSRPWVPDYSAATSTHRALAAYAEDTVTAGTATAIQSRINTVYGVTI